MVSMEQIAKTDAELVADALAGNREAFGQLYDRHARTVRALVAAVSTDWNAVADMKPWFFLSLGDLVTDVVLGNQWAKPVNPEIAKLAE